METQELRIYLQTITKQLDTNIRLLTAINSIFEEADEEETAEEIKKAIKPKEE